MNRLQIFIDADLKEGHPNYTRLVETNLTIDGPRSRLTSMCYPTVELARQAIARIQAE